MTVSVTDLHGAVQRAVRAAGGDSAALHVTYVRRKPGRGLLIVFDGARDRDEGWRGRGLPVVARAAAAPAGDGAGISIRAFPDDPDLPALRGACDPTAGSRLWRAVEQAARRRIGPDWSLASAGVEILAYKPGDRCVLRYHLAGAGDDGNRSHGTSFSVVGKVHADPVQARTLHAVLAALHRSLPGTPVTPEPLGLVDALGLVLTEDVGRDEPRDGRPAVARGPTVLRPSGGASRAPPDDVPLPAIAAAAQALARIHMSDVAVDRHAVRTAALEARRARGRAARLAAAQPADAHRLAALGERVADRLEACGDGLRLPSHGSFKPSQLLFTSPRSVVATDFDQFAVADPALDVGCFLAYLRPSALWAGRCHARTWFEAAGHEFGLRYREAMVGLGAHPAAVDGIVARSGPYEAALLLKIAARRLNRLTSPRPRETLAIASEVAACLGEDRRGRG